MIINLHSKGNSACCENNSLSVTVTMKFNHILKCNHEVVMNIVQCLLKSTGHIHVCQDSLGHPDL